METKEQNRMELINEHVHAQLVHYSLIISSFFLFILCIFGSFLGLGCRALIRFCLPFQAEHCILYRFFYGVKIKVLIFSLPSFQFSQPK